MKNLVLIGGGHSHAIALKQFSQAPVPNTRLILISDCRYTPYSGMLPGYIAGYYHFTDCHIDLPRLAQISGANLIQHRAVGLDLEQQTVLLADHDPVPFDVLSIDIGIQPAIATIPGASPHAIPVKPISQFLQQWDQLIAEVSQASQQPIRLAVIGGGVGGVELALAIQARFRAIAPGQFTLDLVHRGDRLISDRPAWLGKTLQRTLTKRGATIHLNETVIKLEANQSAKSIQKFIHCQSGKVLRCDRIFLVTQASAADWIRTSLLATDPNGFIAINDYLQSLSHPNIFAAGDIATMVNHPRPKAGVFAVRQGQPLAENLQRYCLDQPLQPFIPQQDFLILIGTGEGRAIASRGRWGWGETAIAWRWKEAIDRRFMGQF
jgi:selenide, water dikinase